MAEKELIAAPDIAMMLSMSESTVSRLVKEGKFPPGTLFGRRRLWRVSEVSKWIKDTFDKKEKNDGK